MKNLGIEINFVSELKGVITMKEIRDSSIGVRITPSLKRILLDDGLPLSKLVEAGIVHFLKLSIEDKICFLADNSFDNADLEVLPRLDKNFDSYIHADLEKRRLGELCSLNLDKKIRIVSAHLKHMKENKTNE